MKMDIKKLIIKSAKFLFLLFIMIGTLSSIKAAAMTGGGKHLPATKQNVKNTRKGEIKYDATDGVAYDSKYLARLREKIKKDWSKVRRMRVPKSYPVKHVQTSYKGVKGVLITGLPYKGKETRFFAWYGTPEQKDGNKVPAVVLVHGAYGTASDVWVYYWLRRGYAAISIDTGGMIPMRGPKDLIKKEPHGYPGPQPKRWGGFLHGQDDYREQWVFHQTANIIIAHTFLASLPGVDSSRTGITGVSWGGFLAVLAASVDNRFKCAAPVFGCGFIGNDCGWSDGLKKMGEKGRRWVHLWDPAFYMENLDIPVLWVNSTNDPYYSLPSLQKSYRLTPGNDTLAIRVDMVHNLEIGIKVREVFTFSNSVLMGKKQLPKIIDQGIENGIAWGTFDTTVPVIKAELNYSTHTGDWKKRKWKSMPAELDETAKRVTANIPENTRVYCINIITKRRNIVSFPHVEISSEIMK
jgi:dienelactone hydrolase